MDNQNQPVEKPQDFELVDLLFRDKIAAQRVLPGPSSTSATPQISESFQARFQSFIDQIPSYMHSSNKPGFFTHFFLGSFSTLLDTQLNADKIHVKNLYYRFDGAKTLKVIAATEHKTHIFIFTEDSEEKHKSSTQTHNNKFEFTKDELDNINSARRKLKQSELNKKIEIKLVRIDDKSKIVSVVESKKIKDAGPAPTKFPFKEIGAQRNPGDYLEQDIEKLSGEDKKEINKTFGKILNDVKKTHTALELSKDVYGSGAREADQHGFLAGVLDNFRYRYNTRIYLEQFAGRGYADIVLLVRGVARSTRSIPIIIELKAGTSAGKEPSNARQQAEDYALGFQPNTVRVLTFSNDVICVGLNLDYVPTDLVKETLKEINQIIDDENHIMGGALKEAIKDKLSEFTETNDPQLVKIIDDWQEGKAGLKEEITEYLQRPFSSRTVSWKPKDTHPCIIGMLQSAKEYFNEKITNIELETEIENDLRRVYNTFPGTPEKGEKHYFSKFLLGQSILIKDKDYKKHVFIYEKDNFIPTEEPSETKTAGRQAKIDATEKIRQGAKVSYDTSHAITTILFVPSSKTETVCLVNIIESNRDLSFNKKIELTDNLIGNRKIRTLNLLFRTDKSGESFDNFFKLGPIDPREPYSNLQEYNNLNGNLEKFNGKFENIPYPAGLKERFDETLSAQKKTSTQVVLLENYKKLFEQTLGETINPFKSLIEKEAHFQGVLHGVWSHYSDLKLSEDPATRAVVLTEFQTGRGNRIDMLIHGIGPLLDPKEYQPIGLEIKGPRKGATDKTLMREAKGQLNDYKTVVYKTLTDGDTVYLVPVVFSPEDKSSLIQLGAELSPVLVVHSSIQLLPKPTAVRAEDLGRIVEQSKKIGLKPLPGSSCPPRRRRRRDLNACTEEELEGWFPYEPLEENVPLLQGRTARLYSQLALAVAWQQTEQGATVSADNLLRYNTYLGDILREGVVNQSPREQDIVDGYYKQAQQFFNNNPKAELLEPMVEGFEPSAGQSRLLENGQYSLLVLNEGEHYQLYSPNFNYRLRFQTTAGISWAEITTFAQAFFQWKSGSSDYHLLTLKHQFPEKAMAQLKQAAFWQPDKWALDRVLLEREQRGLIKGIPATVVKELFRVRGQVVDYAALHADFFKQPQADIQLRLDRLHEILPELTADQRRALVTVVKKYQWAADSTILENCSDDEYTLLNDYQQRVLTELKTAKTITPERLSELSWQAFSQGFEQYPDISPELKQQVLTYTKDIHAKVSKLALAKGMGTQTLFFLPDIIRSANTGQIDGLMTTAGMLIGDTSINHAYNNLVNQLETVLPEGRVSLLRKLPVTSPIFKALTVYSIVELSIQLKTLPPGSVERSIVEHRLGEQVLTAGLMAAELLGFELGPLWIGLMAEQLIYGAISLRQQYQLDISFWEAFKMSLGFEQDKLQHILTERQLVEINLGWANSISTQAQLPYGWVIVKVPVLSNVEWKKNVSKVPENIETALLDFKQPSYKDDDTDIKEVYGFRQIKKFKTTSFFAHHTVTNVRGELINTHWEQKFCHVTDNSTTVYFSPADYGCQEDNIFLSNFEGKIANYHRIASVIQAFEEPGFIEKFKIGAALISGSDSLPVDLSKSCHGFYAPKIPLQVNGLGLAGLYVNNHTFSNDPAQRNLYLWFDPYEGDVTLDFTAEGLKKLDEINLHNNQNYTVNDRSYYQITIQIGHKSYPCSVISPQRKNPSTFQVKDNSHQIYSKYLVQDNCDSFNIIDNTTNVDLIFSDIKKESRIVSNDFLKEKNRTVLELYYSPYSNLKSADSSIQLLGNKEYLRLVLSPQQRIEKLTLSAKKIEILNARGREDYSSTISMDCSVETFTVTVIDNLHIESCGTEFAFGGSRLSNATQLVYRKLLSPPELTLYELQLSSGEALLKPLLDSLVQIFASIDNRVNPLTSFQMSGLHCMWNVFSPNRRTAQLIIKGKLTMKGQLEPRNASLTLQEEQFTLVQLTDTFQPALVLIKHYTTQTNLTQSLRLLEAEQVIYPARHFLTSKGGVQLQRDLEGVETLVIPSGTPGTQGAYLVFQHPQGYPEIHGFASDNITLNGINYQVKTKNIYATGAPNGVINGNQLLRYNGSDNRPVNIYFPTPMNESQLSLDNGILSVNRIQLEQIPQQTRFYFGPMGPQQKILSLKALQDTLLPLSSEQTEEVSQEKSHRRHRRQIPDMPSSATRLTPWITTLWKGLLEMLPSYSTPWFSKAAVTPQSSILSPTIEYLLRNFKRAQQLLNLGIREKPVVPPMTKEIFFEPSAPLDLDKLNSFMLMLSFFLELRRTRKQQKTTSKTLPNKQAITHKHRFEWLKELGKLEKNVEDLFKRLAQEGKMVDKRHEWPQWWLADLQEQWWQFTQVDHASPKEITVFEEKLQATLNELDEILQPSAVPPGGKRHAGQSFHKTDTTEPESKPKPAEDLDDIIQDVKQLFSEKVDIISAIKNNDLRQVKTYLGKNDVNARTKGGRPLLMVAVESSCNNELIELLIDNGSDINAEDRDGESAINLAAYNGSFRLIKLLINKGVKIKDKTEKNSPFSSVAESGLPQRTQDQVIKLLTEWKYIDKTSNATNLTRILVQQLPAMHSSTVDNTFTSLGVATQNLMYSNRVSSLLPISKQ